MTKREFLTDEVWKEWTQDYENLRHYMKNNPDRDLVPLFRAWISFYRAVL